MAQVREGAWGAGRTHCERCALRRWNGLPACHWNDLALAQRYQPHVSAAALSEACRLPCLPACLPPLPPLAPRLQGEILKMDRYKAPRDKLLCLVNVKTMVESIVQLAARGGAAIGGEQSRERAGGRGRLRCCAVRCAAVCVVQGWELMQPASQVCAHPTHACPACCRRRCFLPRLPVCRHPLPPAPPGRQRRVCEALPPTLPPHRPV